MNNTVALDSHAEATENRPISPIEHDRVAAAAAAHDALAIGEPLLIVAGGPAAVRADLCRALTVDRLAVGEDVLVLATRTDGAFPESSLSVYLGLPADAGSPPGAPDDTPDDALAGALAQYATAETRLVLMLANAERLDEGGVAAIRRLRQADPAARALSVVLLGDDMVGLVGDRLLRPAPPGGLRFIRLTPLALAPAAPVAALPAGPLIAPPVMAPPAISPPIISPPVMAPPETALPVGAPPVATIAASLVAPWAGGGLTELLAEPTTPPHDDATPWDAAPESAVLASGPADGDMAHDQAAHDRAAHDEGAHDEGAYDQGAYGHGAYDEEVDDGADLALEDEPADAFDAPETERRVPYWETLPERVPEAVAPPEPETETAEERPDHVPAPRDWHSYQDTPDPAPGIDHDSPPAEPDHAAHMVAPDLPPPPQVKEAGRDKDWGSLKAAAQTGRYPPAADGEHGSYAPAEASYQDAFAQLAAQEARAVEPPRAAPHPMLRRAQVLAGSGVGQPVDEDGAPVETRSHRPRMILPFAGIAVLAALVGWFVFRSVVGAGHPTPPGMQTALSTPDPSIQAPSTPAPSTQAAATPALSPLALSTTAPKDAPPALPSDPPVTSGMAAATGAPPQAGAAPPAAVPPSASETAAALPQPPERPSAAHVDPGLPPPPVATAPAIAEAGVPAAHPPAAPATTGAPPLAHSAPQHPATEQQAMAPPLPPPPTASQTPMAAPALPPGPGLLVIAKAEDTLQSLYSRVYKGLQAPPFEVVEAMNPHEIKLGDVVVFPAPPGGWHRLPNTAGR